MFVSIAISSVIIYLYASKQTDNEVILSLGILLMWFGILFIFSIMDESYKQGQIDALNGNIKYELRIVVDSTAVWEEIPE